MNVLKALGTTVPLGLVLGGAVAAGLVLLARPGTRRFATHWLAGVTGSYVAFGLPVVANTVASGLPAVRHDEPSRIPVLIVFDGDNRRGRLEEAMRVLERDHPAGVWILGDVWFVDQLMLRGVAHDTLNLDTATLNTRDQIAWAARYVQEHPTTRPAIVVSRLQAPRVTALIRKRRLAVDLVVSPIDDEPPSAGWRAWIPSYVGLRTSRDAIYEHAALLYYRWNGWIGP